LTATALEAAVEKLKKAKAYDWDPYYPGYAPYSLLFGKPEKSAPPTPDVEAGFPNYEHS